MIDVPVVCPHTLTDALNSQILKMKNCDRKMFLDILHCVSVTNEIIKITMKMVKTGKEVVEARFTKTDHGNTVVNE